ncbi:B3 domain-containing protein REM14-like [Malania oleifera]|uniref:B3 domain-containing protein REM14-like n=1 Tax=Malania oleifera TaxID=397392 RepID=UPI0025AE7A84|nr:B3 domain-containing protein REM14-like [Malania oleifera]
MARPPIPPTKPHFFQPLLPGFHLQLLIPSAFFLKYLGGDGYSCKLQQQAVLRSCLVAGKQWPVKVNGRRLEEGWPEFAGEHDLRVGDLLVFRHEGDMVFHVMVFDPTACQKEYYVKTEAEEVLMKRRKLDTMATLGKATKTSSAGSYPYHPYFVQIVTSSNFQNSKVYIPIRFARENGLAERICEIALQNEKGKSWLVNLRYKKSDSQVFFGRGLRDFFIANDIKEGDSLTFELIENGIKPIFVVHGSPMATRGMGMANQVMRSPTRKTTPPALHQYFVGTINQHCLNKNKLKEYYVKTEEEYCLRDDEKYQTLGTHHEAEEVMKRRKLDTVAAQAKATETTFEVPYPCHSYFVHIVTSYSFRKSKMQIPKCFARANGLTKRTCEIAFKNEKGKSWSVQLWYKKSDGKVMFGRGLRDFFIANGIKKGDSLTFELIENGIKPIFTVHGSPMATSGMCMAKQVMRSPTCKTTTPTLHQYFVATINQRCLKMNQLNIPVEFARANDLCNKDCEIILRDQKGRLWPMMLSHMKNTGVICIGRNLSKFITTNGLKVGDLFMLELDKAGGKNIIMNFYGGSMEETIA